MRGVVSAALEKERADKRIASSLQATVTLYLQSAWHNLDLESEGIQWADFLMSAHVTIIQLPDGQKIPLEALSHVEGVGVFIGVSSDEKCQRCWRYLPEVIHEARALCQRCASVVDGAH